MSISTLSGITIDPPAYDDLGRVQPIIDADDSFYYRAIVDNGICTGYEVVVSIAHVSDEVPINSFDDELAFMRAHSRYYDDASDPMLSPIKQRRIGLYPGIRRKVIVFRIFLDATYTITDVAFEQARFLSSKHFTYEEVAKALADPTHHAQSRWIRYHRFAQHLFLKRHNQGVYTEDGLSAPHVVAAIQHRELEVGKVAFFVREFMTLVNIAVTQHLLQHGVTLLLFRNHVQGYPGDTFLALCEQSHRRLGTQSSAGITFNRLYRSVADRAYFYPYCHGHYALELTPYAQWTAPIRRFADLVNHRQLVAWLQQEALPYTLTDLHTIAQHLNTVSAKESCRALVKTAKQHSRMTS